MGIGSDAKKGRHKTRSPRAPHELLFGLRTQLIVVREGLGEKAQHRRVHVDGTETPSGEKKKKLIWRERSLSSPALHFTHHNPRLAAPFAVALRVFLFHSRQLSPWDELDVEMS
jgi:hypothetical protein